MAGCAEALLSSGSPGTAVAPFVRVLRSESAKPASYRRREPEKTLLHRTIREHLSTFLRDLEETDVRLPRTVTKELQAYLSCGQLSAGFIRGECRDCRSTLLVAFSCKGRTACPSCGAKRMAAEAAHLVDRVFPSVQVRHWVLSLPFDLRYVLARQRGLLSSVLRIFVDEVFLRYGASFKGVAKVQGGAVASIHRGDSALRLSPHFHVVFLDGVYLLRDEAPLSFVASETPSDLELRRIAGRVARRVRRLFIRRGFLTDDGVPLEQLDEGLPEERAPFGWLTQDGEVILSEPNGAGAGASRGEVAGFSVFASGKVAAKDRARLEKLCRYVARPPLANERLKEANDGRIAIALKKPRRGGETHAFLTPLQLIRRISSLIPPAGMNLIRYFGILAPAAKHRAKVVPVPEVELDLHPTATPEPEAPRPSGGVDWASLLRRVYDLDALRCPCGGRIRILSVIEDPAVIRRILGHLKLPVEPAPRSRARAPPEGQAQFESA